MREDTATRRPQHPQHPGRPAPGLGTARPGHREPRAPAPAPDRPPAADPALGTSREILRRIFGPPSDRSFAVRYWDGSVEAPERGPAPSFTLVLERPGALRRMLLPPTERNVGAGYVEGYVDVEGDLEAAVAVLAPGLAGLGLRAVPGLVRRLRSLPRAGARPAERAAPDRDAAASSAEPREPPGFRGRLRGLPHTRRRDRAAVRYHYDVSNDFYALWLDRRMVYSCAYFESPDQDLDAAQAAKLDLVCRKLRLRPGERLLDVGCGWGALVLHAAERYGVRATGVTLSERQAALTRERIRAAGLEDRCRIEVRDYRDLPADWRFDKVASIGMVEHVGEPRLRAYHDAVFRHLEAGGLFLNQGIVTLEPDRGLAVRVRGRLHRRWASFIEHYVFPDARLLAPATVLGPAGHAGFELRDVENLREHYARTLRHWVRRLEARRDEAVRLAGEEIYRVWRLYMAGSAHRFAAGRIAVLQTLLAKPGPDGEAGLPLTRADLYRT